MLATVKFSTFAVLALMAYDTARPLKLDRPPIAPPAGGPITQCSTVRPSWDPNAPKSFDYIAMATLITTPKADGQNLRAKVRVGRHLKGNFQQNDIELLFYMVCGPGGEKLRRGDNLTLYVSPESVHDLVVGYVHFWRAANLWPE